MNFDVVVIAVRELGEAVAVGIVASRMPILQAASVQAAVFTGDVITRIHVGTDAVHAERRAAGCVTGIRETRPAGTAKATRLQRPFVLAGDSRRIDLEVNRIHPAASIDFKAEVSARVELGPPLRAPVVDADSIGFTSDQQERPHKNGFFRNATTAMTVRGPTDLTRATVSVPHAGGCVVRVGHEKSLASISLRRPTVAIATVGNGEVPGLVPLVCAALAQLCVEDRIVPGLVDEERSAATGF